MRYAKWTGLAALGMATVYTAWHATSTQTKTELAWKFVKGAGSGLFAGSAVSGFFYHQEHKNDADQLQQPGTVVAFKQ